MQTNSSGAADLDLSVVLPAYLEEENLRILLPRLNDVLKKMNCDFEILVVDTMTPLDNTKDACIKNSVRYVPRKNGNFFGDAVRTGISVANGKHILFMDADGSHTPEFIPVLWEHRNTHDLVIASRYVDGGFTENSAALIWMSRILNFTYALVLGLNCKDVSNSFKLYRAEHLKSLSLKCNNFDIVEELLFKICKNNRSLNIKEVPFSFKKRMFGDTKRNLFVFILTYLYTIVRLRLRG